jgi:ABC-type transport system involved in multi-copper enzyme maturation permease subunit
MRAVWTIACKEALLLARDPRAGILLLVLPLVFILTLGLALGEGFGQKPDERLRVSLVDLDQGYQDPAWRARQVCATAAQTPVVTAPQGAIDSMALSAVALCWADVELKFPPEPWAKIVRRDLAETAGIRVEIIPTRAEADRLVASGRRAAILVFGPRFSEKVHYCSFLAQGINPFFRDGVNLDELDATILRDPTQLTASSIIEQVAQVSLLRVILPWMIGRAFEKLAEPSFMSMLAEEVPGGKFLPREIKESLGNGVQGALRRLFPKYNLTGKTWAALTKSLPHSEGGAEASVYTDVGLGMPKRGAVRYQILVPSYTVTFAFFLVLTVGWLFVSERRQGTLKRLRAAPITRAQILLGKLSPCFVLSVIQGVFLLISGKLAFGMRWGPDSWSLAYQTLWLLPVILCTSWAAMGLALLIASLAKTETQVAIYGTPLVLVLAAISGCLMPRDLMPDLMKQVSLITPQAWALEGYMQLLLSQTPDLDRVLTACAVLVGFGAVFLGMAWALLKLE